jgi:hypothetical protein
MNSFTEKKWFVYIGDRHEGPLSMEELQGKMASGQISSENYIWAEGMADWQMMKELPDFSVLLHTNSDATVMITAPSVAQQQAQPSEVPSPNASPNDVYISSISAWDQTNTTGRIANINIHAAATDPSVRQNTKNTVSNSVMAGFLRKCLYLILFGALGLTLYLSLQNNTALFNEVQEVEKKSSEIVKPYLLDLTEKFPFLETWISPIPDLQDVSANELEELRFAARGKPEASNPPRLALALSKSNPLFPVFYLSSSLPDGALFRIYVVGKLDTLLNQLSFGTQLDVEVSKKLGKSRTVQFSDGKPIPRGEYFVYVSPSEHQPESIQQMVNSFQGLAISPPSELPKNTKIIAQKLYFLGGAKDATYLTRLKDYHSKLQEKASKEITEIRQFTVTLSSQLELTNSRYSNLKPGKLSIKQKKLWENFHIEWTKLQGQLDGIFLRWTPEMIRNDFFYGPLYSLTQQAGQEINKVHGLHHLFFTTKQDPKTYDIQLGALLGAAYNTLNLLKSKTEMVSHLHPTVNGMPRRDGI